MLPRKNLGKATQQGFGIVEILLVLAIIGVGLAAVFGNYSKGTEKQANKVLIDQIFLIRGAATSWRGVLPEYTGISITALTDVDLLDSAWGAGSAVNAVGGDYAIAVDTDNAAAYVITATGLSVPQCALIARGLANNTAAGTVPACSSGTLTATFR